MVSTTTDSVDSSYILKLANGTQWNIKCLSPEVAPLVAYFAKIMDLQPGCSDGPTLYIRFHNGINRFNRLMKINEVVIDARDLSPSTIRSGVIWRDKFAVQLSHIASTLGDNIQIYGGILLHAACVERKGKGVLLAAPGGTGKSTASGRLPQTWKTWSDDACLIIPDLNNQYWIHPWPTWSRFYFGGLQRATWEVKRAIPLACICFIEQSEFNWITPNGQGDTTVCLVQSNQQMRHPWYRLHSQKYLQSQHIKTFNSICDLAFTYPAFRLGINLTEDFWSLIENELETKSHGTRD